MRRPIARRRPRVNLAAKARSIDGRAVVVPSMVKVSRPPSSSVAVTVVTPSSVIPPVVAPQVAPEVDGGGKANTNVTVSHSFSVVSVKYSTDDDLEEEPPPTLQLGGEAEGRGDQGAAAAAAAAAAASPPEFESSGGALGLPSRRPPPPPPPGAAVNYQRLAEGGEKEEISSQDVTTETPAALPAILKVAEIEGFGLQKDAAAAEGDDPEGDFRYDQVVESEGPLIETIKDSSAPVLDQRAFELDYYEEEEDEEGDGIELYTPQPGQFTDEKVPKVVDSSEEESDNGEGQVLLPVEKVAEEPEEGEDDESDELKAAEPVVEGANRSPKSVEVCNNQENEH